MKAAARLDRISVLIGSPSALSNTVIIGFAAQGLLLTIAYARLQVAHPLLPSLVAAACSLAASCGLLLLVRRIESPRWSSPRPGLVLASLAAASVIRSLMSVELISGVPAVVDMPKEALGRTIAATAIAIAICVGLGSVVQLSRERGALLAELLAEQARLSELAQTMGEDLDRADQELRVKAHALLEPTIAEVRRMLDGELSRDEATKVSTRISEAIDLVVRPVSRELAVSPAITLDAIGPQKPAPLNVFHDRMDVPGAIRPTWVLLLIWCTLLPGPLLVLRAGVVMFSALWASLVFWLVLQVARRAWPSRWRSMRIVPGLGILLALFTIGNVILQFAVTRSEQARSSPDDWATMTPFGLIVRIALSMLVVVLAMLDDHGKQTRAKLFEINHQLEELIARLRRESWLLHRSVALAVHGPVQSALVSTAMRLAAPHRTPASVEDARRRLDASLAVLTQHPHDDVSIDLALDDLRGLWEGIVRINVDVDSQAHALLAGDAGLRRCVIEVCRESASNAIRHGQAQAVTIALTAPDGRIEVRVTDDGMGFGPAIPAGLGMSMLDDTCLRWSLRNIPSGGAELTATVV